MPYPLFCLVLLHLTRLQGNRLKTLTGHQLASLVLFHRTVPVSLHRMYCLRSPAPRRLVLLSLYRRVAQRVNCRFSRMFLRLVYLLDHQLGFLVLFRGAGSLNLQWVYHPRHRLMFQLSALLYGQQGILFSHQAAALV